ncbi:MAG: hypothetical protein ACREDT_09115 [Methylocella sp.]
MQTFDKNYAGWVFVGISLAGYLCTVSLARFKLTINKDEDIERHRVAADIVFVSVKKIVFSKVSSGAEIVSARQTSNESGHKVYIFEFTNDASLTIAAEDICEFLF